MKKNFKLVLALILALMMILGSVAALADDAPTGSITIKPSTTVTLDGKTLYAYEIMTATHSTYEVVEGGETVTKTAIAYTIPESMEGFFNNYKEFKYSYDGHTYTAKERAAQLNKTLSQYVSDIMKNWGDDSSKIKDFANAALAYAKDSSKGNLAPISGQFTDPNYEFTGLEAGYYLVEDAGSGVSISAVMLDTVTDANIDIVLKASDLTEKEILTVDELQNKKADELGLGRAVDYKITQQIPDTTGFDYYYYMINDTLSTGLTFNPESVIVKVGGTKLTEGTDYYLYYLGDSHNTNATLLNGKTFIVAFKNIVADIANEDKDTFVTGAPVEITYNATINSEAIVGVDPNTNKASVEYSNNPDKDGQGDYDEDHPGIPLNDEDHPTGIGPDKWTDTYTTKVTIFKEDGQTKQALPGVEFTLTGKSKDANFKAWQVFEIDADGDYWLLNDGTYTTSAPELKARVESVIGNAGWVAMNETEKDAYVQANSSKEGYVEPREIDGTFYRPYVADDDGDTDHYKIIEANASDYASTTIKYKLVTKTSDAAEEYDVLRVGVTGSDGKLSFAQLGAGTFTLKETGVLDGYNKIPDITFTISCTLPAASSVIAGTEKATWSISCSQPYVSFTQDTNSDGENLGTFSIIIDNNKGVELPSTGGIGTTIFYIGGSILVLAAAILLITKRRMSSND